MHGNIIKESEKNILSVCFKKKIKIPPFDMVKFSHFVAYSYNKNTM